MADTNRINFTGVVISYNEQRHLKDCLDKLSFCKKLIVLDLGSTDKSVEIANSFGAQVILHDHVPYVELIRAKAVEYVETEWFLMLDPDEILPYGIEYDLQILISNNPEAGVIKIPMQYYFCKKPLHTTRWGGVINKERAFHKERVSFIPILYQGFILNDGYQSITLPIETNGRLIKHFWVDSLQELFEKHYRYINADGETKFKAGKRYSTFLMLFDVFKQLFMNLIIKKGILGGISGVFLSFFFSWYVWRSWLSLRDYQKLIMSVDNNYDRRGNFV